MGIVLLVGSVLVIATIVTLTLARKDKPPTGSSTVRQSLKSPMADNLPKKRISSVHINNAKIVRQESKSKSEDFKTPEVRNLAIEYKGEYHKEYPFLDSRYSPGSRMPFTDLTLYVSEWIGDGKTDALYELWKYIGDFRGEVAMREALRMSIPEGIEISDFARNEILAIYALTLRAHLAVDHADYPGAAMMATTFSTRNVLLSSELKKALQALVKHEFTSRNQESDVCNYDVNAETKAVLDALEQGVSGCEKFAAIMKTIPPTVRVAISDSMRDTRTDDSLWNRRIHYSLGYGERAYGCSEKLNRECAVSLGILEPVNPSTFGIPTTVTKAMITNGLLRSGVPFKKTAKRDDLLRLADTVPGLVAELLNTAEPDLMVIKSEYAQEARTWARRNQALFPFALAFMAYMGLERIKQPTRRSTLRKVLDNQAAMVSGEFQYGNGRSS